MKKQMLALCCLFSAVLLAGQEIRDVECGLRWEKEQIVVLDKTGMPVMRLGDIPFVWSKPVAKCIGVEKIGEDKLKLNYQILNDPTNQVKVSAEAVLTGHGFRIEYRGEAPDSIAMKGAMQQIYRLNGTERDQKAWKCGYWVRPPESGVPFEINSHRMKIYKGKNQAFWKLNPGWTGATTESVSFQKEKNNPVQKSSLEFITANLGETASAISARLDGRNFILSMNTPKRYNIWESGEPEFTLSIWARLDGNAEVKTVVLDYDGNVVLSEAQDLAFQAGDEKKIRYTLPAMERGIYFVESSIIQKNKEYFCRTNLVVLPPHEFTSLSTSPAGMGANPPDKSAYELMKRLGVHYLRNDDHSKVSREYGMTAYFSRHSSPEMYNEAKHAAQVKKMVEQIKKQQNPVLEYGNEVGWGKPKEEQARLMKCYGSWIKVIRKALDDNGLSHVKLITFGIQPDYAEHIMTVMKQEKILDSMDGLTLHPGRGWYTADCINGGWVYRGIIHKARKKFTQFGYGDREIHMTEVYAATHPNDHWKDSYRQSAENTLLSIAIAYVEGVKNMMFYKLHQGTSQDPNGYPLIQADGISNQNAEYDFGLLMRDDSPKPSLLAYAAAAEQLDGAEFLRELVPSKKNKLSGFEFKTPRGNLAILYDRTDGQNLAKLSPHFGKWDKFRHKEAWEEHWKTVKEHTFDTTAPEVVVIDMIGRKTVHYAENGKITLKMNGAPLMIYGLNLNNLMEGISQ